MSITWPLVLTTKNLRLVFTKILKKILALGGIDLCKWFTNTRQLREKKLWNRTWWTLCVKTTKNIDANFDLQDDKFVLTLDKTVSLPSTLTVTKRNTLKITNMFFDPLCSLCPIVLQAKIIFTKICILKTSLELWSARRSRKMFEIGSKFLLKSLVFSDIYLLVKIILFQ